MLDHGGDVKYFYFCQILEILAIFIAHNLGVKKAPVASFALVIMEQKWY